MTPKIELSRYGYICYCSRYWGEGRTRAMAFDEWRKARRIERES